MIAENNKTEIKTSVEEEIPKKKFFLKGIKYGMLSVVILVIGWFGFILIPSTFISIKQDARIPSDAWIWHPEEGAQVMQGDTVIFNGGYTNRSVPREDTVTWTSSIDGILGSGGIYDFESAYLTPGTHIITLTIQHGAEKVEAHHSLIVRQNPILTSQGRIEFLKKCQKNKNLDDCLAEVVVFLAVWDRKQALDAMNQYKEFNYLRNSYEWSIEKFTSARPHKVELCTEISNLELRNKCVASASK